MSPTSCAAEQPAAARVQGDVSVLMPVHVWIEPEHFRLAIESVATQTVAPREVVVVVDGPVTSSHEAVLAAQENLTVIRLAENRGAGAALSAGLAACRSTWVMRADADDINARDRLERQLALLSESRAQVCTAAMVEFASEPDRILGLRSGPTSDRAIARRMRSRNPVNHPTAMFDRRAAMAAGGYQELPFLEDYDLWARMLRDGCRFVGTEQPLVHYRTTGMLDRRRQAVARCSERVLQRRLRSYTLIGPVRQARNRAVRGAYLLLPLPLLRIAYGLAFRRRVAS